MTLAGLPHHEPWDLTGFDPDARRAFTCIGNRGWLRTHGSQLCPACLDEHRGLAAVWRLQTATCCTRHHTYLATHCPTCWRPFRDQRSPLRPVGAALTCGTPAVTDGTPAAAARGMRAARHAYERRIGRVTF